MKNKILGLLVVGFLLAPVVSFAQYHNDPATNSLIISIYQKIEYLKVQISQLAYEEELQAMAQAYDEEQERIDEDHESFLKDLKKDAERSTKERNDYFKKKDQIKDAIKAEVEASGGFITNSQLESMALDRLDDLGIDLPSAIPMPSAVCNDGSYSYSNTRSGTCSWHGGVGLWF